MKNNPAPWRITFDHLFKDGTKDLNPNLPHRVCEHCKKEQQYPDPVGIQIRAKGWGVAQLLTLDPVREFDQHMANARLIAAAPVMLDTLETIAAWIGDRNAPELAKVNSAIALAKGERHA
jgi:hypothetical protein